MKDNMTLEQKMTQEASLLKQIKEIWALMSNGRVTSVEDAKIYMDKKEEFYTAIKTLIAEEKKKTFMELFKDEDTRYEVYREGNEIKVFNLNYLQQGEEE